MEILNKIVDAIEQVAITNSLNFAESGYNYRTGSIFQYIEVGKLFLIIMVHKGGVIEARGQDINPPIYFLSISPDTIITAITEVIITFDHTC